MFQVDAFEFGGALRESPDFHADTPAQIEMEIAIVHHLAFDAGGHEVDPNLPDDGTDIPDCIIWDIDGAELTT